MQFRWTHLCFPFFFILFIITCSMAPIQGGKIHQEQLADGVFEGHSKHGPNEAWIRMTVSNQTIAEVEIIEHDAWLGKKAEPIIPARIIEKQSTRVDAVSGATNSSNVIMNAVENAIQKSYQKKGEKS